MKEVLAILGLWTLFLYIMFYFVLLPKTVERRARDLNLMQYDGQTNRFELKADTIQITKWDLHYLQHGHMNMDVK
jgi:hypothetical protein